MGLSCQNNGRNQTKFERAKETLGTANNLIKTDMSYASIGKLFIRRQRCYH